MLSTSIQSIFFKREAASEVLISKTRNIFSESANLRFAKCADLRILDPHNFANLRILRIIFCESCGSKIRKTCESTNLQIRRSAKDADLANLRSAGFANLPISRSADSQFIANHANLKIRKIRKSSESCGS